MNKFHELRKGKFGRSDCDEDTLGQRQLSGKFQSEERWGEESLQ